MVFVTTAIEGVRVNVKKKVAVAAITMGIVAGSVLVTAAPAMAASKVYTKDFVGGFPDGFFGCTNYLFSPPKGVHPDLWKGCQAIGNGTWRLWYTR
jgi:hypothetical protein